MLLGIDYISTCIIHFKCWPYITLGRHVGGRFFMTHSVHQCTTANVQQYSSRKYLRQYNNS